MSFYKRNYSFDDFKPWLGSLILVPICIWLAFNEGKFIFLLDHFNLLIHEGGHGVFKIFGGFIYTLGGSLMQIILPGIFMIYFITNKKRFGLQLSIVWLGENLMNIAVYAADARSQALPLLGGNKVYHDWNWMLSRLGWLQYDKLIGDIFYYGGVLAFVIAILAPLYFKVYKTSKVNLDL